MAIKGFRAQYCKNGHPRTPENVDSNRRCRECQKIKMRIVRGGSPDFITPESVRRESNRLAQPNFGNAKEHTYKKLFGRHEHRVVAEQMLGRPLEKGEIVHHINGDRHDNRPENLEVMTQSRHVAIHRERGEFVRPVQPCC